MKFIADSMLGRLARWLRLLGHDTLYYPRIEDSLLLRIAREENRVLLTRDTRLVKVRGLNNYLLLSENDPFEQLRKVITTFGISPFSKCGEAVAALPAIRCSLCNSVLEDVPKEQAKDRVPEYVYLTTESFKKCQKCDKFYWEGTHREKLRKKLMEILYN
jgi:uncharacterized protein with PIN domain